MCIRFDTLSFPEQPALEIPHVSSRRVIGIWPVGCWQAPGAGPHTTGSLPRPGNRPDSHQGDFLPTAIKPPLCVLLCPLGPWWSSLLPSSLYGGWEITEIQTTLAILRSTGWPCLLILFMSFVDLSLKKHTKSWAISASICPSPVTSLPGRHDACGNAPPALRAVWSLRTR